MNNRLYNTIKASHSSEKSARLAERFRQFVFDVTLDANKGDIKTAIEDIFSVKVQSVNTLIRKGKKKMYGRKQGARSAIKKAYVTLKPGHDIDFILAE